MIEITQEIVDKLVREAKQWKDDSSVNPPDAEDFSVQVDTIVSGATGRHQPEAIAKALELEVPPEEDPESFDWNEDPEVWEYIDQQAGEIAEQINAMVGDELPGTFYFGHREADGDYGIMYYEDKEALDLGEPDDEVPMGDSIDKAVNKILDR